MKKTAFLILSPVIMILLLATPSNQNTSSALIWTDRGCGSFYTVYDPITVYFAPYADYDFELWSYHSGKQPQLLSAGVGTGQTFYVTRTVGSPEGQLTFVLSMSCSYGCHYCGMCDYGECTVFVQEYVCDCSNQCYGDDLWAMKCVNGVCVKDYMIEKNSSQCGYDPCKNVACTTVCRGYDLWAQKCVNGACVDDRLLEKNSITCGYDPCSNIVCRDVCKDYDLWSQKCSEGACVEDRLLEANSVTCGYDPCQDHCTNRQRDCGEYGVDCGGGCPFIDSDLDGVEDCKDLCGNSRCNKVDINGCEIDVDRDGVMDCEDDCPNEQGDPSERGCPKSMNWFMILGGIGAAAVVGSGLVIWGLKGGRAPGQPKLQQVSKPEPKTVSRSVPDDIAMRKEAAERIARETAEEVARKKAGTTIAEEASKQAGTKIAEEAAKGAGTKMAEAGAGITGMVAKREKEVYCPNCGEKMPPDSKFCSKCGHQL
ncbi:MAG: zinc-ribbon domain-containing protein [Candidatus Methanofastidiosia archaeon]